MLMGLNKNMTFLETEKFIFYYSQLKDLKSMKSFFLI